MPGHMYRVLGELVSSGLVLCRDQGRANTYEFADPGSPVARRLKELFTMEERRRREVVGALGKVVPEVLSVVLFGSEARGDATAGSDTDLLIVVDKKTARLEDRVSDACLRLAEEHQLSLSWLVADPDDLREWEAESNDLWRDIRAQGVRLAGKRLERVLD